MKWLCISLYLLALTVNGFSDLIPSENFSVTYQNSLWTKCNPVKGTFGVQEVLVENSQAAEKLRKAQESLEYARILATVQQSPIAETHPIVYSLLGYQCSTLTIDALRYSLEALRIIAVDVDAELAKLELEIGNNFTGPGSIELIVAKEAANEKGEMGQVIKATKENVAKSAAALSRRDISTASETAIWIIGEKGAANEVYAYFKQIRQRQQEIKELIQFLESELEYAAQEAKDIINLLKVEEVSELDAFELNFLSLQDELRIGYTFSTTPAGLLEEAEAHLAKAATLEKIKEGEKARGKSARRINNLNKALFEIELTKEASEKSLEKTREILDTAQQLAAQEVDAALKITSPVGQAMARKVITEAENGKTYFDKIKNLNNLIKTLANLRRIYSGELTEQDKLKLKIEIRELQRIASEAEKRKISAAGEISTALNQIYSTVDEITATPQLITLEEEVADKKQLLFNAIENKFGYLNTMYSEAVALEKNALLDSKEEKKLDELRGVFADNMLPNNIGEIEQIEKALKEITASVPTQQFAPMPQNHENLTVVKSATQNVTSIDYGEMQRELDSLKQAGLSAFYSTEKTKKSIEQVKFEEMVKKADKTYKELTKRPDEENANTLKSQLREMESIISDAQRKASTEIAIAETRGANEAQLKEAQKKWEEGKYTEAIQIAKNSAKQASELTGRVVADVDSGFDAKLLAAGISLVIILIGAAYLLYVKKNEQQPV